MPGFSFLCLLCREEEQEDKARLIAKNKTKTFFINSNFSPWHFRARATVAAPQKYPLFKSNYLPLKTLCVILTKAHACMYKMQLRCASISSSFKTTQH